MSVTISIIKLLKEDREKTLVVLSQVFIHFPLTILFDPGDV
jgi:hypothetical protein